MIHNTLYYLFPPYSVLILCFRADVQSKNGENWWNTNILQTVQKTRLLWSMYMNFLLLKGVNHCLIVKKVSITAMIDTVNQSKKCQSHLKKELSGNRLFYGLNCKDFKSLDAQWKEESPIYLSLPKTSRNTHYFIHSLTSFHRTFIYPVHETNIALMLFCIYFRLL